MRRVVVLLPVALLLAAPAQAASPPPPPNPIAHLIHYVWKADAPAAKRVAWCESRWNRRATNGQYKGIFQLSLGIRHWARNRHPHWHDVAYTPWENIRAARMWFNRYGWAPWSCRP